MALYSKYTCPHCIKTYTKGGLLINHLIRVHNYKEYWYRNGFQGKCAISPIDGLIKTASAFKEY